MMLDRIAESNTLFSYVVKYDNGSAPNPDFGVCTLAICKSDIRRTAQVGDVIVGLASNAEFNRVVYCMVVDEILAWSEYIEKCHENHILQQKIPKNKLDNGDCLWCKDGFLNSESLASWSGHGGEEMYQDDVINGKNVLLGRQFWYFGRGDHYELYLPEYLHGMHIGRGYRSGSNAILKDKFVDFFNDFLDDQGITVVGKLGKPAISQDSETSHSGCSGTSEKTGKKCI